MKKKLKYLGCLNDGNIYYYTFCKNNKVYFVYENTLDLLEEYYEYKKLKQIKRLLNETEIE